MVITTRGAPVCPARFLPVLCTIAVMAAPPPAVADAVERVDYLTFAQGAMPVGIGGAGATLGANFEKAVRIIDGDGTAFEIVAQAAEDADTEFVYALPAPTTFDRFAVPGILETPSPITTFTRRVEVYGSAAGPDDGFVLLASATLETHAARGMVTELPIATRIPVRWVKLRLVGGINVMRPQSSFEFSELIGNGTQEVPEMSARFDGAWRMKALTLGLEQEGPAVSGCYEQNGRLTGTVTGNLLRATGATPAGIPSAFILGIADDGSILGVRSTNRGPFRLYTLPPDSSGDAGCSRPPPPALGCGSIIHGITFAFDSAAIRADSEAVLAALYRGLQDDKDVPVVIEGHTSSEGAEEYNQRLSERRAQAVVADLVGRGLEAGRVTASGIGEKRPIASNADENGRSLNRRVEVHCG